MQYRTMGRTGVQVSALGLGTRMTGSALDEASMRDTIDAALGQGVNFIDTAETYAGGQSEELLGRVLGDRRHDVVIGTKTGSKVAGLEAGGRLTRKRIVEKLEASLRRLRTDYVDLYYFHFPDPLTPVEESLRVIDDLVRAGKIRYFAVSNHAAWQLVELSLLAERHGWTGPAVTQMAYNMLDRSAQAETTPACLKHGISIVPHSPLASGFLTGKFPRGAELGGTLKRNMGYGNPGPTPRSYDDLDRWQQFAASRGRTTGELALAWLMAQPAVCSVIPGITSRAQLDAHLAAASWALSPEDLAELG